MGCDMKERWCQLLLLYVVVISCDVLIGEPRLCWRATPQESQHYSCCHHITYEDEAACQLVVLYHRAKRKEKREGTCTKVVQHLEHEERRRGNGMKWWQERSWMVKSQMSQKITIATIQGTTNVS